MKWSVKIGRWRGVPIHVHANTVLGLYVFSGFRFLPEWWACTLALVLLHELGHAWVVHLVGGRATEVMLTGFGGYCRWEGDVSPLGRAAIACGGVAAQLILLSIALTVDALGFVPEGRVAATVLGVATFSNAWLIGINLIPIAPLDGAEAWAFPYRLGQLVRRKLTTHRNVLRAAPAGAQEQAKNLAAQLLEDARKGDDAS
jgi:stage IV sporulation protein FB